VLQVCSSAQSACSDWPWPVPRRGAPAAFRVCPPCKHCAACWVGERPDISPRRLNSLRPIVRPP